MKRSPVSARVVVLFLCLFSLSVSAEDSVMLQGFDPEQAAPVSYSQANRSFIANKFAVDLFHHAGDPEAGNSNGKLTVVEFFDYRCSHCMSMSPILKSVLSHNPNIRIIYKEFPIRGNVSEFAAKAAIAANAQEKYVEFHDALMNTDNLDDSKVLALAKTIGLDIVRLQSDMDSQATTEEIQANYALARSLGIQGTPTFYITQSNKEFPIYIISGEAEARYLDRFFSKLGQ